MKPTDLPLAWREAGRRPPPPGADPLPERRLARLLAAFIAAGLVFLVLPGTLVGVWNLLGISGREEPAAAPLVWVQGHGHAQLFGWVGTFMIGISLYTLPKFRGGRLRSLTAAWVMFGLWVGALAARWASALWGVGWRAALPASAAAELAVALLLIWQTTPASPGFRRGRLWNRLIFAGFGGLAGVLAWQLILLWPPLGAPVIPPGPNHLLLTLALWWFAYPVAWGYSVRFLPAFLGLAKTGERAAWTGLAVLVAAPVLPAAALVSVALACWSLRIFHPSVKPAKTAGVDPRYPVFARLAFAWLAVSAALGMWPAVPGMIGASRHAFTVGFLAMLIFSIGPRILPSFLNSRELWSPRLMLWALVLLTAGCALRVVSEPLAYAGTVPAAWSVLPVSAVLELTAVLLFALNIGATQLSPMPAWIAAPTVNEDLPLYWYVTSYPETRALLVDAGLRTLARARSVPRALTLREAAAADGVECGKLVAVLREYFERRLARSLRKP